MSRIELGRYCETCKYLEGPAAECRYCMETPEHPHWAANERLFKALTIVDDDPPPKVKPDPKPEADDALTAAIAALLTVPPAWRGFAGDFLRLITEAQNIRITRTPGEQGVVQITIMLLKGGTK